MKLNGVEKECTGTPTIAALLEGEGYDLSRVAVLRGGQVVPKEKLAETKVAPDDAIEVVAFVGGG